MAEEFSDLEGWKDAEPNTFTCSYSYDGDSWGFHIYADSWEDAEAKMEAIKKSGQVDGRLMGTVPADDVFESMEDVLDEVDDLIQKKNG